MKVIDLLNKIANNDVSDEIQYINYFNRIAEKNDIFANGILDDLIRKGLIPNEIAISLMNDSAYAYEISENNLDRVTGPLKNTRDFYQKICLRNDLLRNYYDNDGIYHERVIDFLLHKDALEK